MPGARVGRSGPAARAADRGLTTDCLTCEPKGKCAPRCDGDGASCGYDATCVNEAECGGECRWLCKVGCQYDSDCAVTTPLPPGVMPPECVIRMGKEIGYCFDP